MPQVKIAVTRLLAMFTVPSQPVPASGPAAALLAPNVLLWTPVQRFPGPASGPAAALLAPNVLL